MSKLQIDIKHTLDFIERDAIYSQHPIIKDIFDSLYNKTGKGNGLLGWIDMPSKMPEDIIEYVNDCGVEQQAHEQLTDELVGVADVIYMTRMQTERHRFGYKLLQGFVESNSITPAVLAKAKRKMIVMHPLPRGPEISTEIDSDPRAVYKRQMANGPFVRMALLSLIIDQ